MGLADRVRRYLEDWNSCSDRPSDMVMTKEYRGILHYFGVYPDVKRAGVFWSAFGVGVITTILILHWVSIGISAVFLYRINFVYFSSSLHYFFVIGISIEYLIYLNYKRKSIATFHSRMYFGFYDYGEEITPEILEIQRASDVRKKSVVVLPLMTTSAAALIVVLAPILDKYGTFDFSTETSINFNLPLPLVYPFDTFTVPGYCLALAIQMYSSMMCGIIFAITGYMCMVTVISIQCQFEVLIHRLATIEERALALHVRRYGGVPGGSEYLIYRSRTFQDCMSVCLGKCVQHHKVILRDLSVLTGIYSVILCSIYIVGSLIVALAMLGSSFWKVLPGNTIASLVLCVAEVSFLGTVCSLWQRLTDLNEELRVAAYSMKWYHCPRRFCKDVMILQENTLKPLKFVAGGLVGLSNETFANIVNGAYSYYSVVIAMRE